MSQKSEENTPITFETQWRVASEELPDEGVDVILATTFVNGPFGSERRILKARHIGSGAFVSNETDWLVHVRPEEQEDDVYHRVTHWHPLSPLPERLEEMPERGESTTDSDERIKRMEPTQ